MRIIDLVDDSKSILVQASSKNGPDIGKIILIHKEKEGNPSNAQEHDQLLVYYMFTSNEAIKSEFREGDMRVDHNFYPFGTGIARMIRFVAKQTGNYFDFFHFKDGTTALQKQTQLLHYSKQVKEEHRRMLLILNGLSDIGQNRL